MTIKEIKEQAKGHIRSRLTQEEKKAARETNAVKAFVKDGLLYIEILYEGYTSKGERPIRLKNTIVAESKEKYFNFSTWSNRFSSTIDIIKPYYIGKSRALCNAFFGFSEDANPLEELDNPVRKKRAAKAQSKYKILLREMGKRKPLPKKFESYCKTQLWGDNHYFIFENNEGICSHCNNSAKIEAVKHNAIGKCPVCSTSVKFVNAGRKKNPFFDEKYVALIQNEDDETVVRYFSVCRTSSKRGAFFNISEQAEYFINVNRMYSKKDGLWKEGRPTSSCFVENHYYTKEADIYPYNLAATLKKSKVLFRTGAYEFFKDNKTDYSSCSEISGLFSDFKNFPVMEKLSKLEFYNIIRSRDNKVLNISGNNPQEILRVTKEKFKGLDRKSRELITCGELQYYRIPKLNYEQVKKVVSMGLGKNRLETCLNIFSYDKIMRYIESQVETITEKIDLYETKENEVLKIWSDYINMSQEIGEWNKKNSMIAFPKHLQEEHDRLVQERNELRQKKKEEKRNSLCSKIDSLLKEIHQNYDFVDSESGLLISAPTTGKDIIREGQFQHICVGSENYLKKMSEGKSNILFLRMLNKPSKPFYTVEIEDGRIEQVKGFSNIMPPADQKYGEKVISFIQKYAEEKQLKIAGY